MNSEPPTPDKVTLAYLGAAVVLGALSALSALLGQAGVITTRVVIAYILAGGLVSLAVVLLLVEYYGFSYFLVGVALLSGYKAFDLLAGGSAAVAKLINRFLGKK